MPKTMESSVHRQQAALSSSPSPHANCHPEPGGGFTTEDTEDTEFSIYRFSVFSVSSVVKIPSLLRGSNVIESSTRNHVNRNHPSGCRHVSAAWLGPADQRGIQPQ